MPEHVLVLFPILSLSSLFVRSSIEDNSLMTIQQDPLLRNPLHSRRQHLALNIRPLSRKILRTHPTDTR